MRPLLRHALVLVVAALALGACEPEQKERDTPVSVGQTPSSVQATARRLAANGVPGKILRHTVGHETQYAFAYNVDGVDHIAMIAPGGRVIDDEVEVPSSGVPAKVADAVRQAHPKAMRGDVRRVTADGKVSYRVELRNGEAVREMQIDEAGQVLGDRAITEQDPDRQAVDAYRHGLR